MYLIKNVTKNFEFDNITKYKSNEQPNVTAKKQYANGKRKKITTSYTDCVINFTFHGLTLVEWNTYKLKLVDGDTFQYLADDGTYHSAKFIFTIPETDIEQALALNDARVDDMVILMEKSDNV